MTMSPAKVRPKLPPRRVDCTTCEVSTTPVAIPFMRVPGATERDIQKATDIGALGIIVPLLDTVEKIENAVAFAKYPSLGRRSQGNGQYRALWGCRLPGHRQRQHQSVVMIENPAWHSDCRSDCRRAGVDAVFVAHTDLGSFRQGDPGYEALVDRVVSAAGDARIYLGGLVAWKDTREG